MSRLAYYYDSSKCMGCRGCQAACKEWNEEEVENTHFEGSYQNPPQLSPDTRMIIKFYENFEKDTVPQLNMLKYQCFHCGDPACVKVCPSGCLQRTEDGVVIMDKDKCIACGYCHSACPFTIPSIGKTVNKCDMCFSRIREGSESEKTSTPACVKACLADALSFGNRDELVQKGKERVTWLKTRGYENANLYGESILGGLGVLSVLKDKPTKYGLPEEPSMPLEITAWKDILNPIAPLAFVGAIGLSAVQHLCALKQIKDEKKKDDTDKDDADKGEK
ncbi:formate dehydrogenase iron-sulfur subunit [Propionispira arboris]|uniref:Formate dehydrogenase iron-sulfur subunit n=1 Tax=Propionispira arboris TaxID=84035 RepID=A0A1H6XQ12_9FIRM|nr:4Fe-4S dicluster domain-containing protein [Propionispira arboris]SEJ30276.1 formate dehydrogenase iron-sulfur subunit [Propionispira arboris]